MTRSNLSVEVQESHILVVLRGTCFRAKYRKPEALGRRRNGSAGVSSAACRSMAAGDLSPENSAKNG